MLSGSEAGGPIRQNNVDISTTVGELWTNPAMKNGFSGADAAGTTPLHLFPTTDPFTSPQSLQLGGGAELSGSSLTIRGLPFGPLDLGTLLSIVATDRPQAGSRAGVGPNGYAVTLSARR